jgi:hypothetical protein
MMLIRKSAPCWLLALLAVCTLVGCGPTRPATVKVSGTVTLDGEAVEGATVAFYPTGEGLPARGVTDAAGNFSLTTYEAGDGALPGEHRVAVSKTKAPEETTVEGEGETIETPTGDEGENVEHLLPPQYASPTTSQLTEEVKSGMDPVKLELTSQ